MGIDISKFKVVYGEKVLRAIAIMEIIMPENTDYEKRGIIEKPKFLDILAINKDGNIVSIRDEAWMFQFLPITGR